ncbi:cupredoxin domain-containing protein [Candidatus Woesearchaeota archaeon]|nr:cupredoxin domain-containing protein [Candidatus Woesearchaeota archaeon]
MKKTIVLLLIILSVLVVGCTTEVAVEKTAPTEKSSPSSIDQTEQIGESEAAVPVEKVSEPTEETAVEESSPETAEKSTVKEFAMTAKRWEFTPSSITVNKGDTVKLTITSEDVTHGFNLPEFGVNAQLQPGKTIAVEFVADKTGTFSFFCSVFCGTGHSGMRGTLIVK